MLHLKTGISLLSLNARGLRDLTKRKRFFLFCKGKNVDFVFLQETHSTNEDKSFWSQQWGDKVFFSHGNSRSAGVAVLLKNFQGKIVSHIADAHGHWLIIIIDIDNLKFILVNIYGYNNIKENKILLEQISLQLDQLRLAYSSNNIIVGGDLNLVQDDWMDRFPSNFDSSHPNGTFNNFCDGQGLTDTWRHLNPGIIQFTWFNSNYKLKSRIDHWLISNHLLCHEVKCNISAAPLTDHCSVILYIKPKNSIKYLNKYWKFNSSLIKNIDYCQEIKSLISEIETSEELDSPVRKWEYLKYRIRKLSISFSKKLKSNLDKKELDIIKQLNDLCCKPNPSEDDRQQILNLQSKLDELYTQRARGAYIRSRARWIEEGEKNSAYFCSLEKRRQKRNSLKSLLVNDIEITDEKAISSEIYRFYSHLYSSKFSRTDCDNFIKEITQHIPKIDDNFKQTCDKQLLISELDAVISRLSLNKSPGSDGLTGDFYRHFWEDIRNLLHQVFLEIFETCTLPTTTKHGIIVSIPKPDKDPRLIDNRRPITLRNSDYKLLTYIFASRLQTGLSELIAETQSGFLKGRSIHNNIRLVMDIIEYRHLIKDNGFILFLDFYKAFDSVEHPFIMTALENFGFGTKFRNLIYGLYQNINSCVILPNGTTPSFKVDVGIPQGCPISPYLFLLATEMLAIYIKNCSEIKKLNVLGTEIIISQLADDTTLFLKDEHQIKAAIEKVKHFSKASGLNLNLKKCELLAIHDTPLKEINHIPIKSEIKYLGIYINKDQKIGQSRNVGEKLDECKTRLNMWLQRDISLLGRIYLTKMEGLSRCIYPSYSNAIPNKMIKSINQMTFNFIWRNKPHYMRKNYMVKEFKDGGLKVIDFDSLNGTLKINWLKSWIKHNQSFWFCIPNHLFNKLGGLKLVLISDFDINKLPIALSEFHKQILLYWKILYVHNFSPHSNIIWNNRYILHRNKSLFCAEWFDRGVWSVSDLMDTEGNLLDYEQFCLKHNFNPPISEFLKVRNSLPREFVFLTRNTMTHLKIKPQLATLSIEGCPLMDRKCNNSFIRNWFIERFFPGRQNKNNILQKFEQNVVTKLRTDFMKLPIPPKVKETHFKIMNDIYPSKELLRLRFNIDDNSCSFCQTAVEDIDHIFFLCDVVQVFWLDVYKWLRHKFPFIMDFFSKEVIIFGLSLHNNVNNVCINTVLCLAKFFIHKNRLQKCHPSFNFFNNEVNLYLKSIKLIDSPKAITIY
uniref:Reverse transcriptase domain-containing protein n=1 Tax=Oryzias latipes TaxID=8090 RepID=A0A3P9J195_ORYLA